MVVKKEQIVNVVQYGAFGWVWGRLTEALKRYLDAQVLVSTGQIVEADKYIAMCPEYMSGITKDRHKDTTCLVHHFEDAHGRTLERRVSLLQAAGSVVTMNGEVAKLLNSEGIDCSIIGYGVDPALWTPTFPDSGLVVGVCGRNYETGRKNPNGIIEVARSLSKEAPGCARFLFCGNEWENVASKINEIDDIEVSLFEHSGDYSRYDDFYREISSLLICSWVEGGPYPALEALASGRRVVSTPVGFMPELQAECGNFVKIFEQGNFNKAAELLAEPNVDPFHCARSVSHRHWESECKKWSNVLGLGQKCLALNAETSLERLFTKLETESS